MSHRYIPHSDDDIRRMLQACGVSSLEDLYADVPQQLRLSGGYKLPGAMSEPEVRDYFRAIGAENRPLTCFAGAGAYDHYTPAVIENLMSRSEFLTAYTPYQPEISQGTLQYIFEYQSMMAQLTGLDACNASMYDGATATAEAMLMAVNASRRKRRVLISATVDPKVASVVSTYARYHDVPLEVIPEDKGVTDRAEMERMLGAGDVAAVIVASPNYYGILEDYTGWSDKIHEVKALMVMNCHAMPLAVIKSPGEWGADIAAGEAQSLGMPLNYGGPYLGYLCTTKALMRKMPGRIVGATTDDKGRRCFVLTLQAREQHIRREKATSNICSNQGIMTLHAAMYMSLMGAAGMRGVNALSCDGAHLLASRLEETGLMRLTYPDRPFLNEFRVTVADGQTTATVLDALAAEGILGGVAIDEREMIVAVTETRSPAQIDKYVETVKKLRP